MLLRIFSLLFSLLMSLPCWAGLDFETLPVSNESFLSQGNNQCVPVSLLYILKEGPSEFQEVYQSLEGESDQEKLQNLLKTGEDTRSQVSGEAFFNPEHGTKRPVIAEWMQGLLKSKGLETSLQTDLLHRLPDETHAGPLAQRVHQKILQSLQKKIPVLMGVEMNTTFHSQKDVKFDLSHAIVVVGVQKELGINEFGFSVWFFDPGQGEVYSGYLYEEIHQPFNALLYSDALSLDSTWSDGKVGVELPNQQFVSSPYLRLQAPLIGWDRTLGWDESRNLYVDFLLGVSE